VEAEPGFPAAVKTRPIAKHETIDIGIWLTADLERLSSTWSGLLQSPDDSNARGEFERAIHNLYGASGAYGGGALTRLSGSLQNLVKHSEHITEDAALINLHVQACRAAALGSDNTGEGIANAVCDALERQVEIISTTV
ncbi:MAG: hypothetical protein L3J02_05835, partial [Henriciella sp.]|nr:hypothetical protein [Henriciella sp.]